MRSAFWGFPTIVFCVVASCLPSDALATPSRQSQRDLSLGKIGIVVPSAGGRYVVKNGPNSKTTLGRVSSKPSGPEREIISTRVNYRHEQKRLAKKLRAIEDTLKTASRRDRPMLRAQRKTIVNDIQSLEAARSAQQNITLATQVPSLRAYPCANASVTVSLTGLETGAYVRGLGQQVSAVVSGDTECVSDIGFVTFSYVSSVFQALHFDSSSPYVYRTQNLSSVTLGEAEVHAYARNSQGGILGYVTTQVLFTKQSGNPAPTPAASATPTMETTATSTPTYTPTSPPSHTPTRVVTATASSTPTAVATLTATATRTAMPSATRTPVSTAAASATPTTIATATATSTRTATPSATRTPISTVAPSATPTIVATATATNTRTATPSATPTRTLTPTPSRTPTPLSTVAPSPTPQATPTPSGTPASSSEINASFAPSKASCVAPCVVQFDGSGTTATITGIPFHELYYYWEFGESTGQNWSISGKSRDNDTGPIASHLYETPGSKTVRLTVVDRNGNMESVSQVITIQDPATVFAGSNTICVSTQAGDFAGCPTGAQQVVTSGVDVIDSYVGTNKRILLRRGATWNANGASIRLDVSGPGMIGAFGTGAAPVISSGGNTIKLSSRSTPNVRDWRLVDLDIRASGANAGEGVGNSESGGTIKQLLLLRTKISGFHTNLGLGDSILDYWNANGYPGHTYFDDISIVDCDLSQSGIHSTVSAGSYVVYLSSERFTILGSRLTDSQSGEHVLRTPFLSRAVIAHSYFSDQATDKHVMKIHAPNYSAGGLGQNRYSEKLVIANNEIKGGDRTGTAWTVAIGPQDGADERVRDVVVDSNLMRSGAGTQVQIIMWGTDMTVRNNISILNTAAAGIFAAIDRRGSGPIPNNVRLFNNTVYRGDGNAVLAEIGAVAQNTTLKNNLVVASGSMTLNDGAGSGLVVQSNLLTRTPGFVVSTPSVAAHFVLQSSSPARNAGVFIPVLSDIFGSVRPRENALDIGAVEY